MRHLAGCLVLVACSGEHDTNGGDGNSGDTTVAGDTVTGDIEAGTVEFTTLVGAAATAIWL
jgi:hypothetical protein